MKKSTLMILAVLAALMGLIIQRELFRTVPSSADTAHSREAFPASGTAQHAASGQPSDGVARSLSRRRELEKARAPWKRISGPEQREVLSSAVDAVIGPDETLVMGGYRTPDGRHELTLLTPRRVTLDDGREAFEVKGMVIIVSPEFVEAHQLGTLATSDKHSRQRAEAWGRQEVANMMVSALDSDGVNVLSTPMITALPSASFRMRIGDLDGTYYMFDGTILGSGDGNIAIQSQVQRAFELQSDTEP